MATQSEVHDYQAVYAEQGVWVGTLSFAGLRALLQSQIDAGQKEEAGKTCHSAVQLARKKVPGKLIEVLKLQVCKLCTGWMMRLLFCTSVANFSYT